MSSNWYVLQLRDRYSKQASRRQLYQRLKNYYGKCSCDIMISLDNINYGLNYYVFLYEVRMRQLWEQLKKQKYINIDFGYKEIDQISLESFKKGIQLIREQIGYGDIVKILVGKYQKLNGIVLRQQEQGIYQVGIKLCSQVIIQEYKGHQLQISGNIFKYIKIRKSRIR